MATASTRPRRPLSEFLGAHSEGISTFLMGVAAVLSAWCAFEGARWSGIQSLDFAAAAASRTESSRHEIAGNQLISVDVATFLAWLQALRDEGKDPHALVQGGYRPDPTTNSGFLYERFRPDFRKAVDAWLTARADPAGAPPTPFAMPEYRRALQEKGETLLAEAEEKVDSGQRANRTSANYMLVTVLSAMVSFFAGMSSRLRIAFNGTALLLIACVLFVICIVAVTRFPVAF